MRNGFVVVLYPLNPPKLCICKQRKLWLVWSCVCTASSGSVALTAPGTRRCCLSSPSPSLFSADQAQLPPSLAPGCWFFKKETSALSSGWWWLVSDCRSGWWMTERVLNMLSHREREKNQKFEIHSLLKMI